MTEQPARPEKTDLINIAVVGVGGWGRNLVRNCYQLPGARLKYVCDLDSARLDPMVNQYPGVQPATHLDELLKDEDLSAVMIATDARTHFSLAKAALCAGKDVYVEKPFVLSAADAVELNRVADQNGRVLMVGHLMVYHPVVAQLKQMVDGGELGHIDYLYSQRLNLGTVREDENALWSLAPHDISIVLHVLGKDPTDVSARGQRCLNDQIEDVVFLTMKFDDQSMAHIHVSWLDPHKVRRMTLVGRKKMAVFDDLQPNEKLRIYDKGAAYSEEYDTYAEYIGLRFGDIRIPYIQTGEPLRLECLHFIDCVRSRTRPLSDGHEGLRVVRILEAAQRSLELGGEPVPLGAAIADGPVASTGGGA